jgi:uncharacterized iron-regulated membrane protein
MQVRGVGSNPFEKRCRGDLVSQPAWRRWHRWIGFVAAPFLAFAAVTGVVAGAVEFFGEDEEAREQARDRVSPVTLSAPTATWSDPIGKALAGAAARAPGAPVDRVTIDFKAEPPAVTVYTGKPGGGEDKKLVFDARTGDFLRQEPYIDKPFLVRLHSGEAFGDWGLAVGIGWGLALVAVIVSGIVIYLAMRRPGGRGLRRLFW